MKSYYKIFMGTLMCFLMTVLACDKEVHVIDGFDFELSETHRTNGFIYERNQTDFKISVKQKIASTKYTFTFTSIEGKGYFETSDGKKIEEGQEYTIADLDWRMNYLSQEIGKNKVKVLVKDNKGFSKEKILEYDIDHAPFTFVISPKANSYIINAKNPISVSLFRDSETKQEDPFSINYYVDNGSAELIQNDSSASKNTVLKPGKKYNILEGTSLLDYLPSTIGKHTLHATAIAPDGAKRSTELDLEVRHLKFDLSTTGESNQLAVNKEYGLTVNLTNEDPESEVSYQMLFEYGQNTSGVVNLLNEKGVEVVPGNYFDISPNTYKYKFSTGDIGRKNLQFTVKDSNGQIKKDSVIVAVETIPLIFKGSPESNVVYINQPTQFNFELTPQGDAKDIEYALQFDSTNGDGTLYQNGKKLEPTFPYMVEPGSFQYIYKPSTLGQHNINFTVTDSNNQAVNVTIEVKSKHVELNLNASASEAKMVVGNSNNINVSLIENNDYIGVTYELSHFITGGTAKLKDENGGIDPSKYHPFKPGSHVFEFTPELPGNYEINFILRDSNNQILERSVSVLVGGTDFDFRATETSNSMALGDAMNINFALTPNTDENRSTYTMIYEKTNDGELIINGKSIAPGEKFKITTNTFTGVYTPKETGSHNLEFTVTDSQGVMKKDQATINVSNGTFEFIASSSPSNILINEVGNINFNLSQSVNNPNAQYELYYELVGPNGIITDDNGNVIEAGVFVPIKLGQFTWNFVSKNEGAYSVNFTVRDNTGITATDNVLFEVNGNSFNFNVQPSINSTTVFDPIAMNMEITETATNSGETYQLRFASNVNAVVEYQGKRYTPGQAIDVPVGEFQVDYIGNKSGNHNISFTITSSSKASVTRDVSVDFSQITFDFIAAAQNNTIYKDFATDLNFNISEDGANSTYQMRYVLNGTNGQVFDESGKSLSPGTYYPVSTGNFNWEFLANAAGTADLTFYVKNTSDLEQNKSVSINVLNGDYTFETIISETSLEVNEKAGINLIFSEIGKSQAPYRVFYSSTKQGALTVNSVSYAPGQTFEIDGTTEVIYTGLVPGEHDITFTVVSSTGNRKQDAVHISYNGGSYDFVATAQSNSFYRSGNTDINFELTEESNPTTYRMRYTITGGNGKMKGENENTLSAGTYYEISPGNFTWNFSADVVGEYVLTFYAENAAGVETINTVPIKVENEDYTLDIISSDSNLEVNVPATISFKISETGASRAPYSVYFNSTFQGEVIYNGNTYLAGQSFEINGNTDIQYKGLEPGQHDIVFTVVSSTGNKKEKEVAIDYNGGSYDLIATAQRNSIYRSENTDINFELTEKSNPTTYRMRYSISGGNGTVLDEKGSALAAGAFYEIVPGQFSWNFSTDEVGDYEVTFYAENAAGVETINTIPIKVENEDYTFDVVGEKRNAEVFELIGLNLNFNNETGIPKTPYTVSYSNANGLDGVLIIDGVEYAPGSQFELSSSKRVQYKGNVSGIHDLHFTAVSTTGNRKTDEVSFDIQFGVFVFNASMNAKVMFRGQQLPLIIHLQEQSANENEYEFRYNIVGGNGGKLLDENGTDILQGMPIDVNVDQIYQWAFTTEVEGDYVLNLEVKSSSGNVQTKSFDITVNDEDYSLDAVLQDPSLEINQKAGFNLTISNNGLSRAPYKVSYKSNLKGRLWIGNDSYQPGDVISIDSEGTYPMLYEGLEEGQHTIEIIAFNTKGKMKTDSFEIEFISGDFSLSAAADKNIVYRLEQSAFNFIVRELSQVPSESFTLTYAVLSESNLKITQNGEPRNAGVPYTIPVNESFKWDFIAEIDGEVIIEFTARNAEGVERKAQVIINVDEEDFNFEVIPSTKQAKVLEDLVDLTFKIEESGVFEDDYEVYYESDRDVVLSVNGVDHGPGSSFDIKNDAVATLRGMTVGTTYLTFHAVPKNGGASAKEYILDIEFTGSNFEFNAGGFNPNSIFKDEESVMNFQILETGGTSSYQMIVDFLNGGGVFYDSNGVEVPRGIWIDVEKGNFNWTFKGTEVHDNVRVRIRARNTLDLEFEYIDEIEVKKTDFDFTAIKKEDNVVVYSPVDVNFNINKKGVETIDYTMIFNVSNGNGVLESLDGTVYSPGQPIDVSEGNFTLKYRGNSVGKHTVNFTVNADNGVSHSDSESISFKQIDFNLNAAVNPSSVYEAEQAVFTITGTETEGGNDSYELMYQVTSSGISGKFYKGTSLLSPATYYPISGDGNFSEQWKFVADDNVTDNRNVVTVKFIAKNTSGVIKEFSRTIDVLKTNFSFTATVDGGNEKYVNQTIPLDFHIKKSGTKPMTYTMYYTSSNGGELTVGGKTYGSNEAIIVTAGASFKGVYKGLQKGNHNATFRVVASNSVEKQAQVSMVFKEIDFTLSGDVNPTTIYERESTTLRVNGQETNGGNDTYTMSYVITGGTGVIKNGSTTLKANTPYNVGKGNFTSNWTFEAGDVPTTSNSQKVRVTLTVKNTSGVTKTAVRDITVNKTNFNFSANILDNTPVYPGQVKPITFDIENLGTKPLTYQMKYSTSGNGKLIYNNTERSANTWFTVSEGDFNANYRGNAVGNHKIDFVVRANNGIEKTDNVTINFSEVGMTFTGYANTEMYVSTTENLNLNIEPDVQLPGVTYQVKFEFSQGDPQDAVIMDQNGNVVSPNTQWVNVPSGDFKWTVQGKVVGNIRLNFIARNSTNLSNEEGVENPIAIKILESPIDFEFEVNYSMTEPPSGGGGGGFIPDPEAPGHGPGDGGIDDEIIFVPMPIKSGVIYEKIPLVFTIEPGQNTIENQTYTMRAVIPSSHNGVIVYNGVTYQSGQKFEVSESEFEAEYRGFTEGKHNIKFIVEGTGELTGSTKEISDNIELTYSDIYFEKLEIIDLWGEAYNPPHPKYKNEPFPLSFYLYMNPDYMDVKDYIDFTMTFSVSGNSGVITYDGQDYGPGDIIPLGKSNNPTVFRPVGGVEFTAETDNDFRITYSIRNNLTNDVVTASKDIIMNKAPLLFAKGENNRYDSGGIGSSHRYENIVHVWWSAGGKTETYGGATVASVHIKTRNRKTGNPVNITYYVNSWNNWNSNPDQNGIYTVTKNSGRLEGKYLVLENFTENGSLNYNDQEFEVYILDSNGAKSNVVTGAFVRK